MVSSRRLRGTPVGWVIIVATLAIKLFVPVEAQAYRQENWMEFVFSRDPQLKDKLLSEFHFPGSHDAGTYDMKRAFACKGCSNVDGLANALIVLPAICTVVRTLSFLPGIGQLLDRYASAVVDACNNPNPTIYPIVLHDEILEPFATAQSSSIYQQLVDGSRWFDLRIFQHSLTDAAIPPIPLDPLTEGEYYIHHTLAGPNSKDIFEDIARFLALGHKEEIIFLRLSALQGETMDINELMDKLVLTQVTSNSTIVDYMAANSLDDPATTINDILSSTINCLANCQVIVTMGSNDRNKLVGLYKDIVWSRTKDNKGMYTNDYADMKDIGTPRKMFKYFSSNAVRRDVSPGSTKRSLYQLQTGVSSSYSMVIDKILCDNLTQREREIGALAMLGICTNFKYDTFQDLEDVAKWTNSILVPALVGLAKEQINVVEMDHYRPWITDEFVRYNLKVARVVTEFRRVKELGCHDCIDLGPLGQTYLSAPDYYPRGRIQPGTNFTGPALTTGVPYTNRSEIAFGGGGRYLETTGKTINPNWQDIRGFGDDVDSAGMLLQIWDSNFGDIIPNADVHSDITPGQGKTLALEIDIRQCILDENSCRADSDGTPNYQTTAGTGNTASSSVRYAIDVCEWSSCNELLPPDNDPSLAYVRIFRGSDRVDKENPADDRPAVLEGEMVVLRGRMTDAGPNDAFDVVVDWGDATSMNSIQILPSNNSMEFMINHTYWDDPPGNITDFTVNVNITGAALTAPAEDSRLVEVQNVDPTSAIESFTNELGLVINEMDPILCFVLIFLQVDITVSFDDMGVNDTHELAIDWSDGTVDNITGLDPSLSPVSQSHMYNISDHLTISTTVKDDDGGMSVADDTLHIFTTVQGLRKMVDVLKGLLGPGMGKSGKGSKVSEGSKRRLKSKSSKSSSYHIARAIEHLEGTSSATSKSSKSGSLGAISLLLLGDQAAELKYKQKYFSSALKEIASAIDDIQASVGFARPFPTDSQNIMLQLVLIAKSATDELIADARSVLNTGANLGPPDHHSSRSSRSTGADGPSCPDRILLAEEYIEEGDRVRLDDEVDAVETFYYKAMKVLCFPR